MIIPLTVYVLIVSALTFAVVRARSQIRYHAPVTFEELIAIMQINFDAVGLFFAKELAPAFERAAVKWSEGMGAAMIEYHEGWLDPENPICPGCKYCKKEQTDGDILD